jgi:hypothetical protein
MSGLFSRGSNSDEYTAQLAAHIKSQEREVYELDQIKRHLVGLRREFQKTREKLFTCSGSGTLEGDSSILDHSTSEFPLYEIWEKLESLRRGGLTPTPDTGALFPANGFVWNSIEPLQNFHISRWGVLGSDIIESGDGELDNKRVNDSESDISEEPITEPRLQPRQLLTPRRANPRYQNPSRITPQRASREHDVTPPDTWS